ncbi:AAA family ATPase [bacterium]|nr:AAA family ATPase [bacterium]
MAEQQKLSEIHFEQLKGLKNVTFSLGEKNVTGIFGPNGCGKSTILHVLLCLYKPVDTRRINYKYSNFFISVDGLNWQNSKFTYKGSYSENGQTKTFEKTIYKKKNRWLHDYGERPARDVYFIGINTSVPDVEIEKHEIIHLNNTKDITKSNEIIRIASDVMNFPYSRYEHRTSSTQKSYLSCKNGDIDYISLSMGAGEQRLFKMLSILVNAPKYSLIVIDEIDLTLHSSALNKLVGHIVQIAKEKNVQVVFTSHRQELVERTDINIRHIVPSINGSDTLCLEQTTTECIERLTGDSIRPIEIFVEDDVSKAIVENITAELKMKAKVSIRIFGDAGNAFRVIAGLQLSGKLNDNIVTVTDGDKYHTEEARMNMMKKSISGTEEGKEEQRQILLSQILQFELPAGKSPDEYIHEILCSSDSDNEIIVFAKSIRGVSDKHQYLNDLINKLGGSRETELSRIMAEASKLNGWKEYTNPVRIWLNQRKMALNI